MARTAHPLPLIWIKETVRARSTPRLVVARTHPRTPRENSGGKPSLRGATRRDDPDCRCGSGLDGFAHARNGDANGLCLTAYFKSHTTAPIPSSAAVRPLRQTVGDTCREGSSCRGVTAVTYFRSLEIDLQPELTKLNVEIVGSSIDPVEDHAKWSQDIERTQGIRMISGQRTERSLTFGG